MRNGVAPAPATQHADNSQRRLAEVRQSAGAVPWHGLILDDQEKPNQEPNVKPERKRPQKNPAASEVLGAGRRGAPRAGGRKTKRTYPSTRSVPTCSVRLSLCAGEGRSGAAASCADWMTAGHDQVGRDSPRAPPRPRKGPCKDY